MSAICQNSSNSGTVCQINDSGNSNICSSSNTYCFGAVPSEKPFGSYILTINNFISIDDRSYISNVGIFNPQNYYLNNPVTNKTITLEDLYNTGGSAYINMTYSISLIGTINPSTSCDDEIISLDSRIVSTNNQSYQKNILNYATTTGVNYNGSEWIILYSGANWLMKFLEIYTSSQCHNSTNIYSNLSASLKVEISFDPYDYCTMPETNNIRNPSCYKFIKTKCVTNGGCDEKISSYLNNYCQRNYADKNYTLSMLNTPLTIPQEDFELCSCNMPTNNYAIFSNSLRNQNVPSEYITANEPSCLVPACRNSYFKSKKYACVTPQCLNINKISDNNVATDVIFNGNNNCESYGFAPINITTSPIAAPQYDEPVCDGPISAPSYPPAPSYPSAPNYPLAPNDPSAPSYPSAPNIPPQSVTTPNYTPVIILAVILLFVLVLFILFGVIYKSTTGKKRI